MSEGSMDGVAPGTSEQRVGTGCSDADDAGAAADEAVRQALSGRAPGERDLVVVMADIAYDKRALMAAVTEAAAPAQVVGCSASASFAAGVEGVHRCVATYVPAGDLAIGVGSGMAARGDLYASSQQATVAAKEAAGAVDGPSRRHEALLLLSDGIAGDQRETVRGAYEIAGAAVPLVGGAAGEDWSAFQCWTAVGDRVFSRGVVAVWIASPTPIGVGIDHGWEPVSRPLQVTKATGSLVVELDGRPALDAYLEARGEAVGVDAESFAGQVQDRPLGMLSPEGGYDVRHIMEQTDAGLHLFGHIHDQAIVRLLAADYESLLAGAKRSVTSAISRLEQPPRGALVFSCAARLMILGDRVGSEIEAIAEGLGDDVAAGGFFTYGEFGRVTGSAGFHNASVAVLAI